MASLAVLDCVDYLEVGCRGLSMKVTIGRAARDLQTCLAWPEILFDNLANVIDPCFDERCQNRLEL